MSIQPIYSEHNPKLYSPEFTSFIISLLKRGNLNDKNLSLLTSERALEKFRTAFTHKSISRDADVNYELLEIVGDGIVNMMVIRYIRQKFPKVVNVMWITKLKHYLISKNWLALVAEKYRFMDYLWLSDELANKFKNMTEDEKHFDLDPHGYMSILEDTMESFFGALVENIDEIKGIPGPGYTIATLMLFSFFDDSKISLDYELIFDPKTRIKELYERREGLGPNKVKWNFNNPKKGFRCEQIQEVELPDDKKIYKVRIYGYPLNDMTEEDRNKVLLGVSEHQVKLKAEYDACSQALKVLKDKYDIEGRKPNPYKRTN